ncbi:hypothetical protein [Vibrio maritimus]|uniref:hypothetical protein n=1 Tax=Vibrio maritimus TaxID=990268 RepID=UPI0037354423
MKLLLILTILVFPIVSFAKNVNDFDLTFSGWSHHIQNKGLNQDNQIVGFRYKQLEAFTLINSFEHRAYGVGWYPQWAINDYINMGIQMGGMTGYTKKENRFQVGGITPYFAPAVTFRYKHFGTEVALFNDVLVFSAKLMI